MKTKLVTVLSVVLLALGEVFAATVSSGEIKLGEWNRRTRDARAYAVQNNIPLLLFRGSSGCSKCYQLKSACATETFLEWQAKRKLVMVLSMNGDPEEDYNAGKALTPESVISSSSLPKIAVYWHRDDGTILHKGFVGRTGTMLGQSSSLPLEEQLINAVDSILSDYPITPDYIGGSFAVEESIGHRYEAEMATASVPVGLVRDDSVKSNMATNKLVAYAPNGSVLSTTNVIWQVGDDQKSVMIGIPEGTLTGDGQKITLLLKDVDDSVKGTNTITCVDAKNSVKNPRWIGEDFADGEWTMDLDAALEKSASDESYTLVAVTGALWCPDCKNTDDNFLSVTNAVGVNRFAEWATQRGVNLVTVDVPNFKSATHTAESPSLLSRTSYTTSLGVQSGLGYLSRKGVSDEDALEVLKRNHQLVSKSSSTSILRRPEDANNFRTGVPIFVLLRGDGTVAARLTYFASTSPKAADQSQWGNIIKRFDEMIEIAKRDGSHFDDIDNNHFSTTKEKLTADNGSTSGEISHVDFMDVYKLDGMTGGVLQKIEVTGTNSAVVKVEIFDDKNTFSNAVTGTLSAGVRLESELPNGNYFVKVSGADIASGDFSVKNPKANNFVAYNVHASLILVPREQAATATATAQEVMMRLTQGTVYRIVGLAETQTAGALEVVSAGENLYKAIKPTGNYSLTLSEQGGEITYQIWKTGTIGFTTSGQSVLEKDHRGFIKLSRTGGSSGQASVKVSVTKYLSAGRLLKPTQTTVVTWNDGESGEKAIDFELKIDSVFQTTDTFVLTLSAGDVCSATLTPEALTHTVTVIDSDKPILDSDEYLERCYLNFEVNKSYVVNNLVGDGRVTLKRVSGGLPSGVRVKYDKDTRSVVFSGKARKAGRYDYSFTITERRGKESATGLEIKFVIEVVDPAELKPSDSEYNANVGKSINCDLPIYASMGTSKVLAGMLDLSISSQNRISAKFKGASSSSVSFSGYWQEFDNGVAEAEITSRRGQKLTLQLSSDGRLYAKLENVSTDFGSKLESPSEGVSVAAYDNYESYSGYYTVTLPVATSGLVAGQETCPLGTGYLVLKMNTSSFNRSGRVNYAGKYADGSNLSGSAYLVPNAYADGSARLCIFKRSSKNMISLVLKVKQNAAQDYVDNPMAVLADDEAVPYWKSSSFGFLALDVYGGYYDNEMDLLSCCATSYNTEVFDFACDLTYFAPSESYGALVNIPDATVIVDSSSFDVVQNNNLTLTMKLAKKTGIVSGRIPLQFANGRTVNASFYGVLLPHWYDCGCSDTGMEIINRPFFSGFAYYTDKVDGKRVKRGFAVDLKPIIEVVE